MGTTETVAFAPSATHSKSQIDLDALIDESVDAMNGTRLDEFGSALDKILTNSQKRQANGHVSGPETAG